VPPAQFIPLAEDTGLIVAIGAWALQRACKDAVHWPEPLSVAVNVSAVEFERGQVRREVRAALAASGLAPHRLEIELTESALLHDSEHAIKLLASLRQMGVRVALDDFGTGFSSLAYLRRLPLDQLKIDRAFVIDLDRPGAGATALSIVAAIHNLASALGLETVAEGIETAEQLRLLTSLGCAFGQGWLFARAMPAVQALQFIDQVQAEGLGAASARLAPPGASGLVPLVGLPVGGRLNVPVSLPDTRWTGAI
jgi:EAL domain-containing protein (putative c-di-GMP-specific phosphodiesterase class I)